MQVYDPISNIFLFPPGCECPGWSLKSENMNVGMYVNENKDLPGKVVPLPALMRQ